MSIHEVTMYEIVCDEPGCKFSTSDVGGDYASWSEPGTAEDEWVDSDLQSIKVAGVQMHFCDKHRRPVCVTCEETASLALDEPDGDLYCPRCIAFVTPPPQTEQLDLTETGDRLNPDCRSKAKCKACSGIAWDDDADALTVCACVCHGGVTA
jgi:hypothetical protein